MEFEFRSIESVKPFEGNPRVITEEAVSHVASSLKQFGWQQPIVIDGEGVVLAGHTRLEAAKVLGFEQVPVHVADNLTPEQARAYRLADNKTGEFSFWDDDKLAQEVAALMESEELDLHGIGFSDADISALAQAAFAPELSPTANYSDVNPDDVSKASESVTTPTSINQDLVDVVCPHCGETYAISKSSLV